MQARLKDVWVEKLYHVPEVHKTNLMSLLYMDIIYKHLFVCIGLPLDTLILGNHLNLCK